MNKDLAIYNELSAAAAHVFSEGINAPVGSYTLSELANIGKYKKAPKGVFFRSDYEIKKIINISIEGFECSCTAERVFVLARRFEMLAKVSPKRKLSFQRCTRRPRTKSLYYRLCKKMRKTHSLLYFTVFLTI